MSEAIQPPADLDKEARELWRTARDQVRKDNGGSFPRSLVPALERYVRHVTLSRLSRVERAGRLTTIGSTGNLVAHPGIKTERDADTDAHRYAEALLLTPAARQKAGMKQPREKGKLGL